MLTGTLKLGKASALNLELEGSIGTFRIGRVDGGEKSIEVRYLETHIGFNPAMAANETMLRQLEPVREIFDFQSLGFDEIMQRDIDDMRVSTELIPYILDDGSRGRIKFFPPIVIVVLPVDPHVAKPGRLYPRVVREVVDDPSRGSAEVVRSGELGQEAFQFISPLVDGKSLHHDLARLKLNTNSTRLVILDGQHRAMALLAIYRNLRDEWTDARRAPFKSYYQAWTKKKIQSFDLTELQLPVIVCTFPELDVDYDGDFDIIKAARTTFLTLNKTARQVSDSRNILLDDRDLVSHLLREVLGSVKQLDVESPHSLRIWNVELDQFRNKQQLTSPMACTGVPHVYYAIEHMLLDVNDVKGVSARSGKFHKRSYVEASLIRRLDGENILGKVGASSLKRFDYSVDAAKKLTESFMKRYGNFLVGAFETFRPFEIHNGSAIVTEKSLDAQVNTQIRTILFEGQGIGRTFESYLEHLEAEEKRAKELKVSLAPELVASLKQLRGTKKAVDDTYEEFRETRAKAYVAGIEDKKQFTPDAGKVVKLVRTMIDQLYADRYCTVAFQTALVCGYFLVVEKAESLAKAQGSSIVSRTVSFDEYIADLSAFFVPSTAARFKSLARVFLWDAQGESASSWKQIPYPHTFNDVVFRAEMKPDEWPKYRYLMLELWRPSDPTIAAIVLEERDACRHQVFNSLVEKKAKDFCQTNQKSETDLHKSEWNGIFNAAYDSFDAFVKNLGVPTAERMSKDDAKSSKSGQPTEDSEAE